MSGLVFGLIGYAGSGKDTAAQALIEGYDFARIAYADSLKKFCAYLFDAELSSFNDRDLKNQPNITLPKIHSKLHVIAYELGRFAIANNCHARDLGNYEIAADIILSSLSDGPITPRRAAQIVGTDAMRKMIDDDIWIKVARNAISEITSSGRNVVITDIRFPNEMHGVDVSIALLRGNHEIHAHESESHIEYLQYKSTYSVVNDGSIEDLHLKMRAIAERGFIAMEATDRAIRAWNKHAI